MQNIIVEKPYKFLPPYTGTFWPTLFRAFRIHDYLLRTQEGVVAHEIDITRFQMLLFTLVTAVFVFITVATTYGIPEIPLGFVTLMGISNGVYLGSKITQS